MANDTRSKIVEAAKPLFAKYGLKKTSVQEIARAAHVAKGAMYYYFKGKEEVFEAIVRDEISMLWDNVTEAVEAVADPEQKIRRLVLTFMKEIERLRNAYAALKDEEMDHLSFVKEIRRNALQQQTNTMSGILQDGMGCGAFRRLDAKTVAEVMVFALGGLERERRRGSSWPATSRRLDAMLATLFDGIRPK